MEPPLSVVLRFGFRPISGVAEFFRPSNLRKRKKLVNVKYVYDVQEIEGTISARCNSQVQRISYDVELELSFTRHARAINDSA